jgi:hypothetical protein
MVVLLKTETSLSHRLTAWTFLVIKAATFANTCTCLFRLDWPFKSHHGYLEILGVRVRCSTVVLIHTTW